MEKHEEQVERVARAIRSASTDKPTYPFQCFRDDAEANILEWCRAAARAALSSIPSATADAQNTGAVEGWLRRIWLGEAWSRWEECSEDQASYAKTHGKIIGYNISAEARPLYAAPPAPDAALKAALRHLEVALPFAGEGVRHLRRTDMLGPLAEAGAFLARLRAVKTGSPTHD